MLIKSTSSTTMLVAIFASMVSLSSARQFVVYNACPFTIWPAIFTDRNAGSALPSPSDVTGWEAPAWSSKVFTMPDNWTAGRIWGRRNCNFSTNPGPTSCLTGGCNGGLNCDPYTGTGVPPATVAEWTLSGAGGLDNYDVSLVDGYNLPMRITNNKGCPVADCAVDLGPNCPAPLKGPYDSSGFPVGCKSACVANLSGDPTNSKNCCSGQYSTPATCPRDNVDYYWYFKGNCPNSYAYAYDESSGTALWTCPILLVDDKHRPGDGLNPTKGAKLQAGTAAGFLVAKLFKHFAKADMTGYKRLSPVVIAIVAWTSFSLTFARNFTIYNACPFTIWPAIYTDLKVGTALPSPNNVTGWEAPPWSTRSFEIPDNWRAGRIWGRRDCDFSKGSGPNSCLTGSCIGTGLNCDLQIGTGVPPATVAEWTLEGENGVDHYDVSLVDGYNLPMRITNNKGCPIAECAIDLSPTCPAALRGPTDSNGWVTGCMSSCFANLTGNPANSKDCCSGEYDTPATCPYQNVDYYWYFKGNCPNAYAYAYDEFSGTALWTCLGSLKADYTLTFCP